MEDIVNCAKKYLGVPYVYGGSSPKGFDCSGFVQYVYREARGINLSRTTGTQINEGRPVGRKDLQPGDLVFTSSGHVTIYIGNNQVIHAPQDNEVVKISNIWAFHAARRIIGDTPSPSPSGIDVFNSTLYHNLYPDLQKAFNGNAKQLRNHWETYGKKEGRRASFVFDPVFYLNKYGDLKNAFGNDYVAAYNHYQTNGIKEGRQASEIFDPVFYLNHNGDLKKAFGNNYGAAINHFFNYGMNEGRKASESFDPSVYKGRYSDLSNAFGGNNKEYYQHFIVYGMKEGRSAK